MEDQLDLLQHGVREGMTDVYVALKRLRRRGSARRRSSDQPPVGLTGADLDTALTSWAIQYPDRVH